LPGCNPRDRDNSDRKSDNSKQEVPGLRPAREVKFWRGLVAVVIVVVPVAVTAPASSVFIPPAMSVFPAPRTGFGKFVAILCGLRTIPAVMLGGFVKLVVYVGDAPLAVVVIRT